jgi:osmotically-inducible protein OsmY
MEVEMNDRNERNRPGRFGREWNEERSGAGRGRDEETGWRGSSREGQYSSDYDETYGSEWERGREPAYDQGGYGSYGRGGYGGDAGYGRSGAGDSQRGRGYYGGGSAGMYGGGSSGGYSGGRGAGNYGGSSGTDYGSSSRSQGFGSPGLGRERGFGGGRDQGYRGRDFGSPGANSSSGSYSGGYAGGYGFGEGAGGSGFGGSESLRRGGFAGRGPKGYTRTDDRIREEVCERLSRDDDVDASEIEVSVQNGEVTLTGMVQTRSMKHQAEDLAEDVSGVNDVHNQLRVMKTMLNELKDKITGKDDDAHYANTGTKNAPSLSAGRNGTL